MHALHNLVVQGKVLYLGISDTPAWIVAQANTYAKLQGLTPFVICMSLLNPLVFVKKPELTRSLYRPGQMERHDSRL